MSENITNVKLLYVPLDNGYKHTLYFADEASQLAYFNGVSTVKSFSDFSYQQKDSRLRVNLSFDESLKYNYVMYQNRNFNNKWFFCFITNYEWKRDDVTELTLETDVLQTWKFNITIKPSFIDREHTNDDTIGNNTIAEVLETGEFICNKVESPEVLQSLSIVMGVTEVLDASTGTEIATGTNYNGIYSGIQYYAFSDVNPSIITEMIKEYNRLGKTDAIKSIFIYPTNFIDFVMVGETPSASVQGSATPKKWSYSIRFNNLKDNLGYTPKNNKLLTYPYVYLFLSNNNGGSAIYHYERFKSQSMLFNMYGCLAPGGSIRIIPVNYKGVAEHNEEGLNLGKFPICNWTSDEYLNWLTQNSVNIGLNLVSGTAQIIGGVATAVGSYGTASAIGGGMILSGVSIITGQLSQVYQQSFTPAQSNGNINNGDVITALHSNNFTFHHMSIKPEYMKVIDEYFSAYGYKTNRIKVPNTNHRERWWFTKTVDANISGQIPILDKAKIKSVYDEGITFWRNASEMKNYTLSNNII